MKKGLSGTAGLVISAAGFFVLTAAFAFICSRFLQAKALMIAVLAVEFALAPAFISLHAGKRESFAACFLITIAGALAVIVASFFGATTLAGGLLAQVVVLAFSLLIAAVTWYVSSLSGELFWAQFVSLIIAILMVGSLFYGNSLITGHTTPAGRHAAVNTIIYVNPLMAVSQSLLGFDLLRWQMMYDRFCVIGGHYKYIYPVWWKVSLVYVAAAGLIFAASKIRRKNPLKEVSAQ